MSEIWKKLKKFDENCRLSSSGKVIKTPPKKMMADEKGIEHFVDCPEISIPLKNINGRLRVYIDHNFHDVAKLVADNFLSQPENPEDYMLCFQDKNKLNVSSSNLFFKLKKKYQHVSKKWVYQFSLDRKKLIDTFPTAAEASRMTKVNYSSLNACLNGYLKRAGNYFWSYEEFPEPVIKNESIYMYDSEGTFLVKKFPDAETAAGCSLIRNSMPGLTAKKIDIAANNNSIVGHYLWTHIKVPAPTREKTVVQRDKVTNRYIDSYPSVKKASEDTGIPASNISAVCNGRLKSAGGFTWAFDELY